MSTFPFPLSSPDDLIMDRNGITGQSNSPVSLRRRRGAMGDPGFDPSLDQPSTSSPTTTDYDSVPSAPSPSSHTGGGGGGGGDFSSPIDTGYSNLTSLTQDPRRQPKPKGVLREILGGVAALHPLTRQFSDDITYGRQAAHDQQDWRQDMGLALQRAKVGEEELGHRAMLGYHRAIAGERESRNAQLAQEGNERGYQKRVSDIRNRFGEPVSDLDLGPIGTIPGRNIVQGVQDGTFHLHPGYSIESANDPLTKEKEDYMIPPRSVGLRNAALAKGGKIPPGQVQQMKAMLDYLKDPAMSAAGDTWMKHSPDDQLSDSELREFSHNFQDLTKQYNTKRRMDDAVHMGNSKSIMFDSEGNVLAQGPKADSSSSDDALSRALAIQEARDASKERGEQRKGKTVAGSKYGEDLRTIEQKYNSKIADFKNPKGFRKLQGPALQMAIEDAMDQSDQEKELVYNNYRARMIDAGQDVSGATPPTKWRDAQKSAPTTSRAPIVTPGRGVSTNTSAGPANSATSSIPPRSVSTRMSEADIRKQARDRGKDEDMAVAKARQQRLID